MNPVIARLAVAGARSSAGRLAGIAGGVVIGVCLILLLWGAAEGLSDRDQRAAWLRVQGEPAVTVALDANGDVVGEPEPIPLTADAVLLGRADDVFRDRLIQRRDIAATEASTVNIPGIGSAPQPGTYYASPALQKLIETTPADQLGDRYGTYAGTIDDTALAGPDSLVVITGATEDQVHRGETASLVTDFTSADPYGDKAATYRILMVLGGIAVLFPVLLLISTSTRLGAAQRAERFAVLRLIGASPWTVARVAAAETAVPALVGAVAGVVAAALLHPVAAQVPVGQSRLYVQDLAAGPGVSAAVVVVVVVASTAAAALGTARAGIGPLGAARARTETTPRAWRALPLLTGLAAMTAALVLTRTQGAPRDGVLQLLLVGGFALTTVGLVFVGPWLTVLVSRAGAVRASSTAAVIAAGRIRYTPVATFRAVSGLVLAVFLVSAFAGASSAVEQDEVPPARTGTVQPSVVYAYLDPGSEPTRAREVATEAQALSGASSAAVLYDRPTAASDAYDSNVYVAAENVPGLGFQDTVTGPVAVFDAAFFNPWTEDPVGVETAPLQDTDSLELFAVVIDTDGTPEALDRARTTLTASGITITPAMSRSYLNVAGTTRIVYSLSVLAHLGTFVAVSVAGISLAVATGAAVIDRRRALGLLRLMGMPLSVLRGVIVREAAVPLLSVLLLSAGLGFFVAWIIVTGLGDPYSMSWPGPTYFASLGLSLALALAAVLTTFGLLRTHTSINTTRFE